MGLVGIFELLESVAQPSGGVAGAATGFVVTAIGQVIILLRHYEWYEKKRKEEVEKPEWGEGVLVAQVPRRGPRGRGCAREMV